MKISIQNMVISICVGLIVLACTIQFLKEGALLVAPAVTAIMWATFSKKEKQEQNP